MAGCFAPGARPVGTAVDIGAYESGSAATGCTEDGQCDDGDICTDDTCAGGECSHLPIEECCTTDEECVDDDECTTDGCDTETNVCYHPVDPECGRDPSGESSVDEDTGYVWVCEWGGYAWTAAGPEDPGVNATISSIEETGLLCYAGVVAAYDSYGGYAMLGLCGTQRGAGLTECGQACVDLMSNLLNCGSCGVACLTGQTCSGGQCVGTPTGGSLVAPTITEPEPQQRSTNAPGCGCSTPGSDETPRPFTWAALLALLTLAGSRRSRRRAG